MNTLFASPLLTPSDLSSDPAALPITAIAAETIPPVADLEPQTTEVWGLPFVRLTTAQCVDWIEDLIRRGAPSYVITANLNWVMLSHQRPDLDAVNRQAAGIVADGMPIVWQSRRQKEEVLPERVAGSELIYLLAERAAQKGWGIYLTGGAEGVAETAARKLETLYPGLRIAGADCPPFRPLSEEETNEQLQRIRDSNAQLLFIAFGQPKGEIWIHKNYHQLNVPVCIQLGASFDFIAGTATRAPKVWQKLGLEWAYRMAHDPKRLVPRYWSNAKFLCSQLLGSTAARFRKSI
jgi:N-acetylglucosaminyldiphosphoundecaprenol N-acetyl-beta-D-mannosaminyltransferase